MPNYSIYRIGSFEFQKVSVTVMVGTHPVIMYCMLCRRHALFPLSHWLFGANVCLLCGFRKCQTWGFYGKVRNLLRVLLSLRISLK